MSRSGVPRTAGPAEPEHQSGLDRWISPDDRRAISQLADGVLTLLAVAFTVLLILQFTVPLPRWLYRQIHLAGIIIWIAFATDFAIRLAVAESKRDYLRHNWLSALAIALPALRIFHIVRLFAVMGGGANADALFSFSRGRRALVRLAQRGGSVYVIGLTVVVCLLTALGEYVLERTHKDADITSYGEALWFVAGTLTTVGTEDDPVTVEGRILAVLLMMYGLGLAGWITAQVATVLLGQGGGQGGGLAGNNDGGKENGTGGQVPPASGEGEAGSETGSDAEQPTEQPTH